MCLRQKKVSTEYKKQMDTEAAAKQLEETTLQRLKVIDADGRLDLAIGARIDSALRT